MTNNFKCPFAVQLDGVLQELKSYGIQPKQEEPETPYNGHLDGYKKMSKCVCGAWISVRYTFCPGCGARAIREEQPC